MQDKSETIVELLTSVACSDHYDVKLRLMRFDITNDSVVYLTSSHALTLDLLLSFGLELGSHCSNSWPHIFRCCIHVKKLEHKYFSQLKNRDSELRTKIIKKDDNWSVVNDLNFDFKCEEETK